MRTYIVAGSLVALGVSLGVALGLATLPQEVEAQGNIVCTQVDVSGLQDKWVKTEAWHLIRQEIQPAPAPDVREITQGRICVLDPQGFVLADVVNTASVTALQESRRAARQARAEAAETLRLDRVAKLTALIDGTPPTNGQIIAALKVLARIKRSEISQ